jgi:hypothetical protein
MEIADLHEDVVLLAVDHAVAIEAVRQPLVAVRVDLRQLLLAGRAVRYW